jgi:outer membrane protein insertion porin family
LFLPGNFEKKRPLWYKDNEMKKFVWLLVPLFLPIFLAGQERVEKIEIIGNERVTRETILYYLSSREGDYFSEEMLRRDFRVLWSTGFFSNIRIEDENGTSGKVVKIFVEENPVIKAITYKTGKKVKQDDIVNKLKEKDEYILPYSYYSAAKVQKVKETIVALLQEKGLQAAKVDVEANKKGNNEVEVLFKIDEGPKVRVGEVDFVGDSVLPSSILREAMKTNRPHGLLTWIAGKDVFKENKIKDEIGLIKAKFQEYGYMEATVGEPRLEEITKRTIFFKKQKMMKIVIPVNAGYRYTVGDVSIEGNKAFSAQNLRKLIKFQKDDIYSSKVREKSVESISEVYRNWGYLYVQVMPVESLDPKNKRVNVTYNIAENEVAYLHRLDFRGNTYTKDKVIRREMLLREGDRFSLALFKDSLLRIKQLGLVDLEKEPAVAPNPQDPTQIDATVNLKELQRNNIQFTAGYSGYEGFFVAASYSTVNFLGAGENLEVTAQVGKRVKNYVFGFSEPYFLDLPLSLGFNIYSRYIILPYLYDQKSKGIDLILGARIRGYLRGNLTYSYQNIDVEPSSYQDTYLGYQYPTYPNYYGYPGYGYGKYNVSAIIPTLYRSTVDSPLTPTRGTMYLVSVKYAGGPLGGQVDFVKPRFEWTFWHPVLRHQVLGLHINYEFVSPGEGSEVPFWERFYLGGERDIRGYDIYSIGPRSSTGVMIGGLKSFVFNAEYQFQVGGPLNLILFYDMGNAYDKNQKLNFRSMYSSTGLEARVFVPALRVPFRLIFAYNNRLIYPGDTHFNFRFAVGTTF